MTPEGDHVKFARVVEALQPVLDRFVIFGGTGPQAVSKDYLRGKLVKHARRI